MILKNEQCGFTVEKWAASCHEAAQMCPNNTDEMANCVDSDQTAAEELIWVYTVYLSESAQASTQADQSLRCPHLEAFGQVLRYPYSSQRRLTRLGRCTGWSESSLGAQIILLVLLCFCSNLGVKCIQNVHLGRYIVGYMVGNFVLRQHFSGAVKRNSRSYNRWYTSPNENFEYGYLHSDALFNV